MHILLITQLFQPEPNHLKGIIYAKELFRQGHTVEVLTGFPNYPGGKIYPGYRQRLFQRETYDGVPIVRVPLFPDHSNSGFSRILCYTSLAFSACIPGLFLIRRPDVVHVYQGPATLALPAIILRFLRRIPFVLDVQDLWPDSVTSSGMLKSSILSWLLNKWCDLVHRMAAKIVVLSDGYKRTLVARGVSAAKIEVIFNWSDERKACKSDHEGKPLGLCGREDRFSIVYAGNLGRVQALDAVLEAASLLREEFPDIIFVFIGDGIDADRLKAIAASEKLDNVRFLPRLPVTEIAANLECADSLLIHLRDDPLGRIGIPQKAQAYLAAGRPIIIAAKGDAADLIETANAGVACEPENPASIAIAIAKLHNLPAEKRKAMGENGLDFYRHHLAFSVGVKRLVAVFEEVSQ
jgi:colanic acid biosynthesis glycosyl transferase WcaI